MKNKNFIYNHFLIAYLLNNHVTILLEIENPNNQELAFMTILVSASCV